MRAADLLTHIANPEDVPYLRIPLFDVNMRLYNNNRYYRDIVRNCCGYIRMVALTNLEDYGRPFGTSGANVAIPFNIIGYVVGRGGQQPQCRIMLNPKIHNQSDDTHVALSNCGSIRLPKPIKVRRWDRVEVHYFDEAGEPQHSWFSRKAWGDTIQHEVDHNRGILITDRPEAE
jgi:peptide deformylase